MKRLILVVFLLVALPLLAGKKSPKKLKLPACPAANACNLCCKEGRVYSFDTAALQLRDGKCHIEKAGIK